MVSIEMKNKVSVDSDLIVENIGIDWQSTNLSLQVCVCHEGLDPKGPKVMSYGLYDVSGNYMRGKKANCC